MYLKHLHLLNFKNIAQADLVFSEKINCFVGDNGVGKTTVLDAIYYLSYCKSYFNLVDHQNITHEKDFFMIQGVFDKKDGTEAEVLCALKKGERKQFKLNKKEYERLSEHIGQIPLVMITPSDTDLVYSGSEERRKYIDGVIAQFDKVYLDHLMSYNKVLAHRNTYLKQHADKRIDYAMMEILDDQLVHYGQLIYETRKTFSLAFTPVFLAHYATLTNEKEQVSLGYESPLSKGDFSAQLRDSFSRDRFLQYTSVGVHKDDFVFKLGDYPLKKMGSQGQQKSFLVAMKLAQFDYTKTKKGYKPILLFDDILDKLDYGRVEKLMQMVGDNHFGQIVITDTHRDRIATIFKQFDVEQHVFEVDNGEITPINF